MDDQAWHGYQPRPLAGGTSALPPEFIELAETLAVNAHEVWASQRMANGWTWGPQRSDPEKTHPSLMPFDGLSEDERQYDRAMVNQTLAALLALGYRIVPGEQE